MYEKLGLNEYIASVVQADAAVYRVDSPAHLMISETMLNGLRREPQVSIMLNPVPQLVAGGLFIPQEIRISAQLLNRRKETERYLEPETEPERLNLGILYAVGQQNCTLPEPVSVQIPAKPNGYNRLALLTDITVFEQEKLGLSIQPDYASAGNRYRG